MPDLKILKVNAERRREMRPAAERLYRRYRDQVPRLIRQLAGPTRAEHDRAFELLAQMRQLAGPTRAEHDRAFELLAQMGEADQRTFNRTLDDIQDRFADRHLWDDIWTILDSEFGAKDVTWH